MKLTQFQSPLAERAVGAAAAAVFLAGIVSAGLVETGGVPGAPTLSAPANVGGVDGSHVFETVDHVTLPTASSTHLGQRVRSLATQTAARDAAPAAATSAGGAVSPPSSSAPGSNAPGSNPQPPASTDPTPTPSVGVAVGPIAIRASPEGAGGTIAETPVGDPGAAPDQSGGVTVEVDTGVVAPIVISLP